MADIVDLLRKMAAGDAALTRGAMGAAVTEIVKLRTEIQQARGALGFAWVAGGVSLAEGIHMKTRHLERMAGRRANAAECSTCGYAPCMCDQQ